MTDIILTQKTKDDLVSEITNNVLSGMAAIIKESRAVDLQSKEWLSSKETMDLLKITSVTLWTWSKSGILNAHKIGSRLRYRKDEVIEAMIKMEKKIKG